jgi:hypothetical protein
MSFQPSAFFQPPTKPSLRERVARIRRYLPSFPPSLPGPETESIRERASRDTTRIRKTWLARGIVVVIELVTLVAVEELLVSANKPGVRVGVLVVLVAIVPFTVLGVLYAWQAARAPFRQRKEWRGQIAAERRGFHKQIAAERGQSDVRWQAERKAFDNKSVETEDLRGQLGRAENELRELRPKLEAALAELERPFPAEVITHGIVTRHRFEFFRLLEIGIEVTNRDRVNGISLSFAAFYYYGEQPEDRLMLPPLPSDHSFFPLSDDVPRPPGRINVAPTKGKPANLVFMWYTDWDKTLAEKGIDKPLSIVGALRLEVTDHVSGTMIEMNGAVSRYPKPL